MADRTRGALVSDEHGWSVGFIVETDEVPFGVAIYEARCSCGWSSRWPDAEAASLCAAAHAGVTMATPALQRRRRGPLQSERLFEP